MVGLQGKPMEHQPRSGVPQFWAQQSPNLLPNTSMTNGAHTGPNYSKRLVISTSFLWCEMNGCVLKGPPTCSTSFRRWLPFETTIHKETQDGLPNPQLLQSQSFEVMLSQIGVPRQNGTPLQLASSVNRWWIGVPGWPSLWGH